MKLMIKSSSDTVEALQSQRDDLHARMMAIQSQKALGELDDFVADMQLMALRTEAGKINEAIRIVSQL